MAGTERLRRGQEEVSSVGRVLVVDDERPVRDSVQWQLQHVGYEVATAPDGLAALALVPEFRPDVIVLDVMMPYLSGIETCRRLRGTGVTVPVLMLTARDGVSDRVNGLDAGADDYLPKPFAFEELLARLRALTRRVSVYDGERHAETELSYADLTMDLAAHRATRGDRVLNLTKRQWEVLELLLRSPERVLGKGRIIGAVWGHAAVGPNAVEVLMSQVRRETEESGEPRLIHTVRGVGYVLRGGAG
jgi:two-component system response regulator MprA